jgi:general secretion pathway protein M
MQSWFSQQFRNSPSLYAAWLAFLRLSVREQRLLILVGILAGVFVGYSLLWQPLVQRYEAARQSLQAAETLYYRVVENADTLASVRFGTQTSLRDRSAAELQDIVNRSARQHGIVARRISLEGDSRLQIEADSVSFAVVSAWLRTLADEGVILYRLQFQSVDVGRINLRITLD